MPSDVSCLACGYPVHYALYHPEDQPLAALNLPKTQGQAVNAARYPMDFHACARCGHIWNIAFDYSLVPYQEDSNRMFNKGSGWKTYMRAMIARLQAKYDFSNLTAVEIGCGDGHFLLSMGEHVPNLRCVGFEPGIDPLSIDQNKLEVRNDYFMPERDLPVYKPGLLICRHVLEHLQRPRHFLAEIAYWCNRHNVFPYFLAEVPRIENAVKEERINDYLYEHVSNFTDASFRLMFEAAGYEVLELEAAYGDEVIILLARPKPLPQLAEIQRGSENYRAALSQQRERVLAQLRAWKREGKTLAFWGGTGKGASFLNALGVAHEEFPLVIDSDMHKVGLFVPGAGQEIRAPDYLHAHRADIIVITTQWRARDIAEEIRRRNIPHEALYTVRSRELQPVKA